MERGREEEGKGALRVPITHRPKRRLDCRDVVEEGRGERDASAVRGHG